MHECQLNIGRAQELIFGAVYFFKRWFPLKWRRSPALSVGWYQWQHRALLGWILIMLIHRWNHGVAISIFFNTPVTEQPIHPKSGNCF